MSRRTIRLWHKLCASEKGSVTTIIAVGLIVLVGAVGLSIDAGRGYLVQSKLSSALDSAGLAAASTVSTTNLETDARKYLDVNFQDYLGSEINDFQVTANSSKTVISLSATAELPTTFMNLFGFRTMDVSASSEITRAISGLELVLALDVTGSMDGTPLSELKTAGKDLIDILFGANTTNDKLWVGVVPFAQAVNVGSSHTDWLDSSYAATLDWGPTSWMGCLDARTGGYDVTDDTPTTKKFRPYYYPDDSANDWIRYGSYRTPLSISRGPNKYCSPEVLPMTTDKDAIKSMIQNLTAVGGTHVNLGAVWGWRMLSPKWRGLWGGGMNANNLPLDYNTPRMNKAIILMTDGENTMYNDSTNRSAYDYLSKGNLGTTSSISDAQKELDKRLSQICTSMKNQNIIVYTIGFRNPGSTISNLLKNCATLPEYYFDSPTGEDLQTAFQAIGDSLSNLRISK